MSISARIDSATSIILTIATVIAVGLLAERRINPPSATSAGTRIEKIRTWRETFDTVQTTLGETTGPIKIVVFTDFECPFCRKMDSILTSVEAKHPGRIARSVIHYPIPGHTFARDAARAFECVARQGRAAAMHHLLYEGQAAFATLAWRSIAEKAGTANLLEFDRCVASGAVDSTIDRGIALANTLRVNSTPTVVVDGWLLDPSFPDVVERAVSAVLAGKTPKP